MASVVIWACRLLAPIQRARTWAPPRNTWNRGKPSWMIRQCSGVLATGSALSACAHASGAGVSREGVDCVYCRRQSGELQQHAGNRSGAYVGALLLPGLTLSRPGIERKGHPVANREIGQLPSPGLPLFLSLLGEVRRKLGDPGASLERQKEPNKALNADRQADPGALFPGARTFWT